MKRDDLIKLRTKTIGELKEGIAKLQKELVDLRMRKAMNKDKNMRQYKNKRQILARHKTVLREKLLAEEIPGRN